ncbi:hypothetical protein U1Q18_016342 [Sarracenia purpurea var. burkii]
MEKERGNEPELELGKAANERAELVGSAGGERGAVGEGVDLGINLRGEEEDEELEDVDTEAIGDDVEALEEVHADGVDEGEDGKGHPTADGVRRRPVEEVLVPPRHGVAPLG